MPVIPSYARGGAALAVALAAGLTIGLVIPRGGAAPDVASGTGPVGPALEPPTSDDPVATGATDETGATPEPVALDVFAVDVVTHECGIAAVTGDHAQWLADGAYCRVRVWVTNTDVLTHPFDPMAQELVLDGGDTVPPEFDAMNIREQPREFELGREVRIEFDLWFDVPEDAVPSGLRWHAAGATAETPLPG